MAGHDVRTVREDEQAFCMNTLMLAFGADPCARYVFPTADTFVAGFTPFATALGGAAFAQGTAFLAGDRAAAALWLPPGVANDGEAIGAVLAAFVSDERQAVLGEVVEEMDRHHPKEPHWYLAMLGVDPARQGQGLGSALLKETLKRCDAEGAVAYLESSNPRNVPLYERHGFEVMGLIQPGDFPPLYPMLRPARLGTTGG